MKIGYIAYNGESHSTCPFVKNLYIGSTSCGGCKEFKTKGNDWVDCKKPDKLLSLIEKLKYKEPTKDKLWFNLTVNKDTKGQVRHLDNLHNAIDLISKDKNFNINLWLNECKHKIGDTKDFGIGKDYKSIYTLKQWLYDRGLLTEFLDKY